MSLSTHVVRPSRHPRATLRCGQLSDAMGLATTPAEHFHIDAGSSHPPTQGKQHPCCPSQPQPGGEPYALPLFGTWQASNSAATDLNAGSSPHGE